MIERYGKDFDLKSLKRDLKEIREMIRINTNIAKEFCVAPTNKITCRICGSNSTSLYLNSVGYLYYECSDCESLFLENIPDLREVYRIFDERGTYKRTFLSEENYEKRIHMIAEPKGDFIVDAIKSSGGGTLGHMA